MVFLRVALLHRFYCTLGAFPVKMCTLFSCHGDLVLLLQVVDIMRVNVDKVLERDSKISELDDRAGERVLY